MPVYKFVVCLLVVSGLFFSCAENKSYFVFYHGNGADSGTLPYEGVEGQEQVESPKSDVLEKNLLEIKYYYENAEAWEISKTESYRNVKFIQIINYPYPEKSNQVFIGWNTKDDGSGVYYYSGERVLAPTSDLKLYAQLRSNWGRLDYDFGTEGKIVTPSEKNEYGTAITKDNQGNLYLAGYQNNEIDYRRVNHMVFSKYDARGIPDKSFGEDGSVYFLYENNPLIHCEATKIIFDGKEHLYILGRYDMDSRKSIKDTNKMILWKYDLDGRLDSDFGKGQGYVVYYNQSVKTDYKPKSMVIDEHGNIYVLILGRVEFSYIYFVLKFNSSGELDKSFSDNGKLAVVEKSDKAVLQRSRDYNRYDEYYNKNADISLAREGAFYILINIILINFKNGVLVLKFSYDGTWNRDFGKDGLGGFNQTQVALGNTMCLDKEGNIFIGGTSNNDFRIWKLQANGMLDNSFGEQGSFPGEVEQGFYIVINSSYLGDDGYVYFSGFCSLTSRLMLLKIGPSGCDRSFGRNGYAYSFISSRNTFRNSSDLVVDSQNQIWVNFSTVVSNKLQWTIWKFQ